MTLDTFFEKFEQLAESPNAVRKLRELVLELAVRGQLSERREGDQKHLAWTNIIDKLDSASLMNRPEIGSPFEIPSHWRWATLNDLGDTKSRNDAPDSTKCSFVPMTLIPTEYGKAIQQEERIWGDVKKGYTHFKEGDVTMAKITPCFENGKSAIMTGLISAIGAGTTELHVFSRVGEVIEPRFVLIYLKSRGFIERGIPRMTGSAGQKRIPYDYFAHSPFPLPPPGEQKRIVAKVDELMDLFDLLEQQQQQRETKHAVLSHSSLARFADAPTTSNLNFLFHKSYTILPADLRKSITSLAVQGKLVPQDANDEPAESLIYLIAKKKLPRKGKEYLSVSPDEIPYSVPSSWSWVRLGNISLTSDSGWSPQCLPERRSGTEWGVLKVSAVTWGVFKPEENKALPLGVASRPECEVHAGDFLLSRANTEELVARSVVVKETPPRLMMSDKIVRFIFPDEIEKDFINLANLSEFARHYYARNASGTSSSMKNVGREVMCNLPVPLPPIAEQRRIVAKVDQLMALVDQLETQLTTSRATAEKLMEAVVAELTSSNKKLAVAI